MNKIKNLIVKYKELIEYLFFGVLTTVIGLGSFKIFDLCLGEKMYLLTNVLSWMCAVIFAFVTNKIWVFCSKSWKLEVLKKEIPSFVSARLLTLGIEELGLWVLVSLLNIQSMSITVFTITINGNMIAKIIISVVVVILNYIFSKFLIFKP